VVGDVGQHGDTRAAGTPTAFSKPGWLGAGLEKFSPQVARRFGTILIDLPPGAPEVIASALKVADTLMI
jgi:hypothetical protein